MCFRFFITVILLTIGLSCGGDRGLNYDGVSSLEHRIFISSFQFEGAFSGGASGIDSACTFSARAAGLVRNYKGLVGADGSAANSAPNRVTIVGPIYQFDTSNNRTLVATDATDLWDGPTLAPSTNESGVTVTAGIHVWTGSVNSGAQSSDHCSSWTTDSAAVNGRIGTVSGAGHLWINGGSSDPCSTFNRIYCLSQ